MKFFSICRIIRPDKIYYDFCPKMGGGEGGIIGEGGRGGGIISRRKGKMRLDIDPFFVGRI